VFYCQLRSNFTNLAWRPGYIKRVEVEPLSIATIPDTKVTNITSDPIHRHEQKTVTVLFIMTLQIDPLNHLGTTRDLPLELTFAMFDNTDRPINRYTSGLFARIHWSETLHLTVSSPKIN
jgi:hypothetical protein